jgi:hypothetical protein
MHDSILLRIFSVACLLFGLSLTNTFSASAQTVQSPPDTRLAVRAALILTPEFCADISKQKHEKFEVGKAACNLLEPALKDVFSSLTVVPSESQSGDAQVVLLPRIVAVDRTGGTTSFSKITMIMQLEWTVKDTSGRTIWLETIQGTAVGHPGTIGQVKGNREKMTNGAMEDVAKKSASRMSQAPELRKVASKLAVLVQP